VSCRARLSTGLRQWRQWFRTWLGEAYRQAGQLEQAREVVRRTLEVCADVRFLLGLGLSHQVLGRIAQAEGDLTEAGRHFQEALRTLSAIGSRFELGRTHLDLASLARARGDRGAATANLREAHSLFETLGVIRYVERAEALARELGASLS
jgi:tetratricopeptide (TPR) repeat protein